MESSKLPALPPSDTMQDSQHLEKPPHSSTPSPDPRVDTNENAEVDSAPHTARADGSDKSRPDAKPVPPLDTSTRGWIAVVGGFACLFVSFGWITCIGIFQAYYSSNQLRNYSASTIGWIPSVESFFLFLGVPIFGGLFDRLGPTLLLIIGTALHVGGLLGLANSTTYVQIFFTQSVLSAIGTGAIFVAGTTATGTWFRDRRGLALGLVSAGSALGAVIGTAVIPVLFDRIGFPWTMRAVALTYFVFMIVAIPCTTRRPHPTGGPPPLSVANIIPVSRLRDGTVFVFALACFFYFLGVFIPYNYLVVEALDSGLDSQLANNLLVVLSATSTVGRVVPGWLGDRYGRFNTTIGFQIFTIVMVLGVWLGAPWRAGLIAFAALYGFGSGTFVSMVPTLAAQVCPDMGKLGSYLGAIYLIIAPSVLITQPIGGILASSAGYKWLKVYCALTMVVGTTGFVITRAMYIGGIRKMYTWAKV